MSKLRRFARNQTCTVRKPGVCNSNPETTVLAHGHGAGMGIKLDDHIACHACSACHDWLDRVASKDDYTTTFFPAMRETLNRLHEAGILGDRN